MYFLQVYKKIRTKKSIYEYGFIRIKNMINKPLSVLQSKFTLHIVISSRNNLFVCGLETDI